MVLIARRVLATVRRASNRPCGLLVPSVNLPPRPIYLAHAFSQQTRKSSNWASEDDDKEFEGLEEREEPEEEGEEEESLVPKYRDEDIKKAREAMGVTRSGGAVPTIGDFLSWPQDYKDDDDSLPREFDELPWAAKRALKVPKLPKEPVTAENLFERLSIGDEEIEDMALGVRTRGEPKWKSRGLVKLQESDFLPEDEEGMADLSDLNTLIGDDRFSESEILNIMVDDTEPENELILVRRMMEETEREMAEDIVRLHKHEEGMLREEIKLRIEQGSSPEEAEHDARAIMRLPQKRTDARKSVSRDLSDEAIDLTDTLWNSELEEMGVKGRRAIMKNLDHRAEWDSRPLKPSREDAMEMYPRTPAGFEDGDDFDLHMWDWNSTDMSSMAHSELEEHREARRYARLAIYDMPRLTSFAKPFQTPSKSEVLRFRYTTYMGVQHPAENKVVMECCPDDLGLTNLQRDKLIKICGQRYNPTRKLLKFSCEKFAHQHQNKRYLSELIDKLIVEAKDDTDTFEDVPFDFRHHKFKPQRSFPKEWRMTPEKLQIKRLKDWQSKATPEELGRLRAYLYQRAEAEKQLAKEKKGRTATDGIDLSGMTFTKSAESELLPTQM
ncbi:hypothetical protein DRE_06981 [Drechslerella stenobrocha 248]|uniref:Small ribosomal subunit protein mS35 mitochondrial conserved domain-containing protein n=1 Tax=Drechslerella stenobrocha 248 TaxID=1043628 RepID=W7HJN4_9PEZI|nr:hypothetical protein DRE_06981 [Drechslerella stenobrocha 248]